MRAGVAPHEAGIDAEVLARSVLGWSRATYLTEGHHAAPDEFCERFDGLVARRIRREPVSLILGQREFWGLTFEVTADVLAPRPETELVVEEAVSIHNQRLEADRPGAHHRVPMQIADVGTGSGCIAVALAIEIPGARITAIDRSPAALAVARRNAARHGVSERITWSCGRCLDHFSTQFDLVVANLPYVPDSEIPRLAPEVRGFEPIGALAGGPDGLEVIGCLLNQAGLRLADRGHLVLEIGDGQLDQLGAQARLVPGLTLMTARRDLQGIPRVVVLSKSS